MFQTLLLLPEDRTVFPREPLKIMQMEKFLKLLCLICHQSLDLAIILFHPFSALAFTANSEKFN